GIDRGRSGDFFSIPPRCLFLFTIPRGMLNANSFNGFKYYFRIKQKHRQTSLLYTKPTTRDIAKNLVLVV
ncbi:hypothetical protein, partial [Enterobacter mori]